MIIYKAFKPFTIEFVKVSTITTFCMLFNAVVVVVVPLYTPGEDALQVLFFISFLFFCIL